jgi:hypothetical protein
MSYVYNILSWDPIHTTDGIFAMIYLKPDLKLLDLFNNSPFNNVLLQVKGTGKNLYDGRVVFGKLDKSSDVPSGRQNFFNSSGLYVITLDSKWYGYPLSNGTISFYDGIVDSLKPLD